MITLNFDEVLKRIYNAKKGVEVRYGLGQGFEYCKQFADEAQGHATNAKASADKAAQTVAGIEQTKTDAVQAVQNAQTTATAAVQQAQSTATTAVTTKQTEAVQAVDNERDAALQQVSNSIQAADTAARNATTAANAAGNAATAAGGYASSAESSATAASGSASAAATSESNAASSAQSAGTDADRAEAAAALAGTRANTDKTLKTENAPADAKATGDALAGKADKSTVQDESGNAIFYSKAEVEAKIKEMLAAQREEDYAKVRFWASDDPTSPASFIGGTWERVEGKFIMGASDTYPAGSTGGSASHYHDYKISFSWNNGAVVGYHQSAISPYNYQTGKYYISDGNDDKIGEGYTLVNTAASDASGERKSTNFATYGSTSSSDTLNPYYSVYIWVRVDDAA